MNSNVALDINEDDINKLNYDLLAILLVDRTTKKNILWATNDYENLGQDYSAGNEIRIDLITGNNSTVIQPRVLKAQEKKVGRTRERAEVFTPSWVCNAQNNLVDEQWFKKKNVFNISKGTAWSATKNKIDFAEKGLKTWKRYVDAKRLEITCGEAPYLVSRYDTVTGKMIPIQDRIGLLDRKLRVVNENTESEADWIKWARRAVESIYGYEFQGDSLLLARENVLYTFIEYYWNRFGNVPDTKLLREIVFVISWNLWQMDGFNYAIPYCQVSTEPYQMTLFDYLPDMDNLETFDFNSLTDTKGQALCSIRDWRSKKTVLFKQLVEGEQK